MVITIVEHQSPLISTLQKLSIPFHTPASPSFETLVRPFNRAFSFKPRVVVLPETAEHVSGAVLAAKAAGVKVQARGGGHSYAAHSTGGQDGSLVIDMRNFQSVRVDQETGLARVGAGVRLGTLATELWKQGRRAIPHGTHPGVGIAGHITHGGYGYHSRAWGLALDTIVSMRTVLASGSIIDVSESSHSDLFFAFRGAAESFGVVIEFTIQTLPAPETVLVFRFDFPELMSHIEAASDAFYYLQELSLKADGGGVVDRRLSFGFDMKDGLFTFYGAYLGDDMTFMTKVGPALLQGFKSPVTISVKTMGWMQHLSWFDGVEFEPTTETEHNAFYVKSIVVPESKPLSKETLKAYFQFMIDAQIEEGQAYFAQVNLYGGHDSQINARSNSKSSYAHRDALWVFQHYGHTKSHEPPLSDSTVHFISTLDATITDADEEGKYGAYLNYVDPELSREEAGRKYYGDEVLKRLVRIKTDVDPDEVFWHPLSIRAAEVSDIDISDEGEGEGSSKS